MFSADSMPDGGWYTVPVAAGQYATVEAELIKPPAEVAPYAAFLRALDFIIDGRYPMGASLLDVGCGVGHYGTLLRLHRPGLVRYRGTDGSLPMIAIARMREPDLEFEQRDILANDWQADIVLMGLVAEMTPQPIPGILAALTHAPAWFIWHRVRLHAAPSAFIDEPTYAGQHGPIWIWNEADVRDLLAQAGRWYRMEIWPARSDHATIIVGPPHDG